MVNANVHLTADSFRLRQIPLVGAVSVKQLIHPLSSHNQVLTHAARAAAKQLNFSATLSVAARARAKGSGQSNA